MVEKAAQDYSKLLQGVRLDMEINPICMNIEDMLIRLDELESLLVNAKCGTNVIMEEYANSILSFAPHFNSLKKRIDNLEHFIDVVNKNVDEMDKSLDIAEEDLNVTDYSLKGLIFKPLLARAISGTSMHTKEEHTESTCNRPDGFQSIPIFTTTDYFDSQSMDT